MDARAAEELLDWKRQIFDAYAAVRGATDPTTAWHEWRAARDRLFAQHPQSPLPGDARAVFKSLAYFDYDPAFRILAPVTPLEPERYELDTSGDEPYVFERVGRVDFELEASDISLEIYWVQGYGGGLFVPFRDATAGRETYGAGRYLLDTVKGADLGSEDGRLVLDFNYSYQPSCAYDPRWVCPLPPPANRIDVSIRAGERTP